MTAIVKHISVHPNFRYARRVGIFDELDKRDAQIRREQNRARQNMKAYRYGINYSTKSDPVINPIADKEKE